MKSLFFITLILITARGEASIRTYFNQNKSGYYTDPYRNISRPGDNLEQVIIDQISTARKTIYLAVMELRLPLIARALIEKKNQGVDVRVVLEHDYNFGVLTQSDSSENNEYEASKLAELKAFVDVNGNGRFEREELETRDAIYMLKKAGIPIMDDTSDASRGSGLMHHKFVVIDEKNTIVSSANFTMSCIHGDMLDPNSRGNTNSLVHVSSTSFAKLFNQEFLQLWGNGKRGNFGHNKTYRGPQTVTVKGTKITVQFSPTSKRYQWEESVNGLIAQHLKKARSSVLASLFVFSDQRLSDVMSEIHHEGAEVGVLIEPKFAYRYYSELLDLLGLSMRAPSCDFEPDNKPWKDPLTEGGMAILPSGDVLHHKFAVIDNKTTIVGSQNWSDAANFLNDETLIVIQNKEVSEGYTEEYNRLKNRSFIGVPDRIFKEIQEWESSCIEQGVFF